MSYYVILVRFISISFVYMKEDTGIQIIKQNLKDIQRHLKFHIISAIPRIPMFFQS